MDYFNNIFNNKYFLTIITLICSYIIGNGIGKFIGYLI